VDQVKFVDRTFNTSKGHALEIFRYLIEKDNGITNFHFEITATLLDEDYFDVLKHARPGLFQFEVGIQTTHQPTMHAIQRPMSFSLLREKCLEILAMGNIHLHVDLIAGLPYETFERFLTSFDDVYQIGAHQLQLGFLKVLKGTAISRELDLHAYKVRHNAPYEVLSNKYIDFESLCVLKEMETLLEYYSNSGKFIHSMAFFMKKQNAKPSAFFIGLAEYFNKNGYFSSPVGTYRLYEILYGYYVETFEESDLFKDLLKVDYYFANLKGQRALFNYEDMPNFNAKRLELLGTEHFQKNVLMLKERQSAKQILKNVEFITLKYDIMALIQNDYEQVVEMANVIMFDYTGRESTKMIAVSFEEEQ
jgi:radical SAM superfamily enzyme